MQVGWQVEDWFSGLEGVAGVVTQCSLRVMAIQVQWLSK